MDVQHVRILPAFWQLLETTQEPKTIDSTRNELTFIVNMSLISIIFWIFCILAILYSPPTEPSIDHVALFAIELRYVLAGLVALFANYFLNRSAIYSVTTYGMMIRSAFGLFRLNLLDQFRLRQPKNSAEEFLVWKNLGELIVLGQESLDFKPIEYEIKKQKE